jgi:hypothetical protein
VLNTYEPAAVSVGDESAVLARYRELCALRDAVNKANDALEKQLSTVNAEAEKARIKATELAARIDDNRGRAKWFALKTEIRVLAKMLSRPNGPLGGTQREEAA